MTTTPVILNLNKPTNITSFDVIRKWKPRLKSMGKIGHFGTLDPFASGVLMLGIAGAQKLNDYIHECLPKTYLAKGVLGIETETGDLTVEVSRKDESDYIKNIVAQLDTDCIQKQLSNQFVGSYLQSPHKYSAAKFEGKPLHQWAREGIDIIKDQVERQVYQLEVVKFDFPDLWIRYTVSSGTYIRTLFSDCAKELGTIGTLSELIREKVGGCRLDNALGAQDWNVTDIPFLAIDTVLNFSSLVMEDKEITLFKNGVRLKEDRAASRLSGELASRYLWVRDTEHLIVGLAAIVDGEIRSKIIF